MLYQSYSRCSLLLTLFPFDNNVLTIMFINTLVKIFAFTESMPYRLRYKRHRGCISFLSLLTPRI